MAIEFMEFTVTVKKLQCHKCRKELRKGTGKIKADMGRRSSQGHIWLYQLCFDCAIKQIDGELDRLGKIKAEILMKMDKDNKRKIMEEKRKWL